MIYRLLLICWLIFFSQFVIAIDLHGIPSDSVVVWVGDVSKNSVIAEYRADASVSPASTMKVLTSFSALADLGANFRWTTKLVSDAPIIDGVLQGDLYWVGSGDPAFDQDALLSLLYQMQQSGINSIKGRLIVDGSIWNDIGHASNFDSDKGHLFMVPPSPNLTAINRAWLEFYFDKNIPNVRLNQAISGVKLVAKLSTDKRHHVSCQDVSQWINVTGSEDVLFVKGKLPRSCNGQRYLISVNGFAASSGNNFINMWHEIGGNGLYSFEKGSAPNNAKSIASHDSPPLSEVLKMINKLSNNTMARSLYLTLGAENSHGADTVVNAQIAERRALVKVGISDEALTLENGSGLSRKARVSARMMGELLNYVAHQPYADPLIDSLPIAGVDGTLKHHLLEQTGFLHMKTGTLNNVRALAGYWITPNQNKLAIVVIVNNKEAKKYRKAMEQIIYDQISAYQAANNISTTALPDSN